MRNVVVLLSGNKRSHHFPQNIQNNAAIEPITQQPGEMNDSQMCAFHSFALVLGFLTFIKTMPMKGHKYSTS